MMNLSNEADCARYGCEKAPWHWASHWVLEQIDPRPGTLVADLGAGNNVILRPALAAAGATVAMIDTLPNPEPSPGHVPIKASVTDIPLDDACCDFAISVSSLEHVPPADLAHALRETYRILKPGGVAAFTLGHLFHVDAEAAHLLTVLPFFLERGCGVYLPLNIRAAIEGSGFATDDLPEQLGDALLETPGLVIEQWNGYEALRDYPCLRAISHCEVGIRLVKE